MNTVVLLSFCFVCFSLEVMTITQQPPISSSTSMVVHPSAMVLVRPQLDVGERHHMYSESSYPHAQVSGCTYCGRFVTSGLFLCVVTAPHAPVPQAGTRPTHSHKPQSLHLYTSLHRLQSRKSARHWFLVV